MCGEKYQKLCTVLSYLGVVYLLYMLYFMMSCVCCCQLSCVYCCHLMCICCTMCTAVFTLEAELLARSQHSEGPATGHLDTGFSWFPCVYKQMVRWSPRFQVATTCFSCSPPDLNLLVTNFIFCIHVNQPLPPSDNPIAVNKYITIIMQHESVKTKQRNSEMMPVK